MIGIEWFGTAASVLVAISLMQKNLKALRILNLIGAAAFSVYGFLIRAWPVFGLNGFIALIDLWYLIDLLARKESFSHYFCDPGQDPFCIKFLNYYRRDMLKFYPELPASLPAETRACVILRNLVPVSLILFRREGLSAAFIELDYATPPFRDFRNARYFLDTALKTGELSDIDVLQARSGSSAQSRYLRRIGYRPDCEGKYLFSYRSALF